MAVGSVGELFVALASGDLTKLEGTREDAWVDFKGTPYQLDADRGKWELAKDVAAFANESGGVVEDWIYPQVRGTRLAWFPFAPAQTEGVYVIEVPAQREGDKYFVVRRM